MWEALFAFHICRACFLPELLRRTVVERPMWPFAVLLPPPACQGASYIVERAEPARIQTLVAQPSVEALDMSVLHRPARLDVHQSDLPVLGPAQHTPRGELRAVVRAQVLWPTAFSDQPLQHSRHAARTQPGIRLQPKTLPRLD